jgi:hypothetical protein
MKVGDEGDTFMDHTAIGNPHNRVVWEIVEQMYFDHLDMLPHHYHLHLMHGAEILGYKHPDPTVRKRWLGFYMRCVDDMHLTPETEEQMDERLNDFGAPWREA